MSSKPQTAVRQKNGNGQIGRKATFLGRSPLDITIEDLKSDANPDGINITAEQLEAAKADYLREKTLYENEKEEEDQDDWNRLQFLEYTTRGLAPKKDTEMVDILDGPDAFNKGTMLEDSDDIISTAGLDSSRFQKELMTVESNSTRKVMSIKEELNSTTDAALQELTVIYDHVAKITSRLYSHELDQNDVLNDNILDKLLIENGPPNDQRSHSRNNTNKKEPNNKASINTTSLQASKVPKAFITDVNLQGNVETNPLESLKQTRRGSSANSTATDNNVTVSSEKIEMTLDNAKYTSFKDKEDSPLPKGLKASAILQDILNANASAIPAN